MEEFSLPLLGWWNRTPFSVGISSFFIIAHITARRVETTVSLPTQSTTTELCTPVGGGVCYVCMYSVACLVENRVGVIILVISYYCPKTNLLEISVIVAQAIGRIPC